MDCTDFVCIFLVFHGGGCGPVVRLLGCHARAQRSVPHIREWHLMWCRLVDISYT